MRGAERTEPPAASVPQRQVRARFSDETITLYQAYTSRIAERALAAGTFVPPFKLDRMTWVKPSFLWMMYRSSWATAPGQERVLAVEITREGFEWALAHASLSAYEPGVHPDRSAWAERLRFSPVRVQWDPERDLNLEPLQHRAIQVGLSGDAVRHYVRSWITTVADMTELAHEIAELVRQGDHETALARVPAEHPYPLNETLRQAVAAT